MTTTNRIKITKSSGTWVVRAAGAVIGESTNALELEETGQDTVVYFPRDDVEMAFLESTDHSTTCPFKGEASYFSLVAKSGTMANAAWSYEAPIAGMERIAGHIAFYSDKAAVEQL